MVEHSGSSGEEQIQQLILQSQKGDESAFGAIYDIYAEPVYRFIYMRVRHKETAEDLMSECFLKTWKGINTYTARPNSKFSTWLFQIAYNSLRDFWRKNRYDLPLEDERFMVEDTIELQDRIDQKARMKRTMEYIAELPESHQTVIVLRFINHMSVEETAKIMKKSNGAVRVLQTRAIRALRNRLT